MIATEQSATIAASIDQVWDYAQNIAGWAEIMPGYRACELIDANHSRWTLKVGVGGLVRTVTVDVQVEQWDGPNFVQFTYRLVGDPVEGSGTYHALALAPDQTEISLAIQVTGSGPMAPMWEALGKPLLPKFARQFAEQLKARIEQG